ncbi:MAG: glycosyltransferase family 4 protein [Ruminococcaceae bacterium]|nr:glycosyltransferase family 4 protein [Oscillospiraceae bacterium]
MEKKLKVALVVDVENWAYANIARHFKAEIKDFDIEIIPMSKIDSNVALMWLMCSDSDIVHFFCRGLAISYLGGDLKQTVTAYGGDVASFIDEYIRPKLITTCVYDHLFLEDDVDFTRLLCSEIENYYVSSEKLKNIYEGLGLSHAPKCVITDGTDLSVFYPKNLERLEKLGERPVVVGWVGNSNWVGNTDDYKGVHTIIKPAVEQLRSEGYNVEFLASDRVSKIIPINEMVNYYEKIDVYVCASKAEGTPNPALESMACGIPVISTDVGIIPDLFGEKQKSLIMEDRSVECLKSKLKYLLDNKRVFKELSAENLESIKKWEWKYKAEDFKNFILSAYKAKQTM